VDNKIAGLVKDVMGKGEKQAPVKSLKVKVKFQKPKKKKRKAVTHSLKYKADKYGAHVLRGKRRKAAFSPAKARQILRTGDTLQGKKPTDKQRRWLGWQAGGAKKRKSIRRKASISIAQMSDGPVAKGFKPSDIGLKNALGGKSGIKQGKTPGRVGKSNISKIGATTSVPNAAGSITQKSVSPNSNTISKWATVKRGKQPGRQGKSVIQKMRRFKQGSGKRMKFFKDYLKKRNKKVR